MTEVEHDPPDGLAHTGPTAPGSRPVGPTARPIVRLSRRRGPVSGVVAATTALIVGGALWWAATVEPDTAGSASCAGVMDHAGRTFVAGGHLTSVPHGRSPNGTGTVAGCDDGGGRVLDRQVEVHTIPGVDPRQAVLADGTFWLLRGTDAPAELRALLVAPPCRGADEQVLAGHAVSIEGEATEGSPLPAPPFVLEVRVDGGDVPGGYEQTTVEVRVTGGTDGATDAAFLRSAIQDGEPVRVTARCVGTAFEAITLTRG